MPRVYVGSFVTGDQAQRLSQWAQIVAQSINDKTPALPLAKATPLQKLHITWQFLGELEEGKIQEVKDKLKAITPQIRQEVAPELVITYNRLALWPTGEPARVAVVTPDVVNTQLSQSGTLIREALRPYLNIDDTVERNFKFMPHLTVMRFKDNAVLDLDYLSQSFAQIAPIIQKVDSINLIESHIGLNHSYESLLAIDV
ncbi:MAG: 2-5 ligase family protein [Cyanobacteriota bacterium erpe_2018_sw_39hr_WHONDRS-SW48-000098_B_bin.30]|jgi:2'-5' RNA ligase|nr:2-5 ligase family protein [Cyanobacteriota bacterium erpe_2018_sw_39hr_WHONDRS-SW48-000098_B_bin.30]